MVKRALLLPMVGDEGDNCHPSGNIKEMREYMKEERKKQFEEDKNTK